MDLPDLKKLDKIIALCRKRGVESIEIDGIKIILGSAPVKESTKKQSYFGPDTAFETDSPSDEDLLFWSATSPVPTSNPENK